MAPKGPYRITSSTVAAVKHAGGTIVEQPSAFSGGRRFVGNHDLDDASGPDAWSHVRGPMNFDFSYGRRHFVVLNGAPGAVGSVDIPADGEVEGPREEALTFLESSFESADAPHRVADAHAAISAGTTSRTPLALPAG
jgi:hypothetical protein